VRTRYFVALIIVLIVGRVADILVHETDPDDEWGDIIIISTSPGRGATIEHIKLEALDEVTGLETTLRESIIQQAQARGAAPTEIGVRVYGAHRVDVVELGARREIGSFTRSSGGNWEWRPEFPRSR